MQDVRDGLLAWTSGIFSEVLAEMRRKAALTDAPPVSVANASVAIEDDLTSIDNTISSIPQRESAGTDDPHSVIRDSADEEGPACVAEMAPATPPTRPATGADCYNIEGRLKEDGTMRTESIDAYTSGSASPTVDHGATPGSTDGDELEDCGVNSPTRHHVHCTPMQHRKARRDIQAIPMAAGLA